MRGYAENRVNHALRCGRIILIESGSWTPQTALATYGVASAAPQRHDPVALNLSRVSTARTRGHEHFERFHEIA
jgi:hypothetical protein